MTLVRMLVGVIGAMLKAFTDALFALFRTPLVATVALVILAVIALAACSACGVGLARRNR